LGQLLKNEYFGSKKAENFQCGPKRLKKVEPFPYKIFTWVQWNLSI
jgi:hypothetical protein